MSTERPDFKAMTDIADLSTAYAALMEKARLKNIGDYALDNTSFLA